MDVVLARVQDGAIAGRYGVLVDRLWPRGVAKSRAPWDEWLKDIAPSDALRRWYGHEPERHAEFSARYREELFAKRENPAWLRLMTLAGQQPVALFTASRDVKWSQLPILATVMEAAAASDAT